MIESLKSEAGGLHDEMTQEPLVDAIVKEQSDHVSVGGTGFFISPLRQPRSREDLERAWKDSE